MTARNDHDYIKEAFDRDDLKAPESLSEDAVRALIAGEKQAGLPADGGMKPAEDPAYGSGASGGRPAYGAGSSGARKVPDLKRRKRRRVIAAVAACCALALISVPVIRGLTDSMPEMSSGADGLHHFTSYSELNKVMRHLTAQQDTVTMRDDYDMVLEDAAEAAPETFGAAGSSAMSGDGDAAAPKDTTGSIPKHSDTYTQVEGIDEADIVKTDGKYIYFVSGYENQVIIAKAADGKAQRVSAANGGKSISYIRNIYILGDQLAVIGSAASETTDKLTSGSTSVVVYDISDRSAPKEISSYTQTGELLSSRLIGKSLCLVTNDYVYSYRNGRTIPQTSYDGGSLQKMPVEDISCFPETASPAYTVVGMLDLSTGKASRDTVKTKAVLGGSGDIYCSESNLYVTAPVVDPDGPTETVGGMTYSFGDPRTRILRVSLKNGKVRYAASTIVAGKINNQFSMDESGGCFKVATTSIAKEDGKNVNNLFILDDKLNEVGRVSNFARDEHIEAVRYIRNKAYVITYRQTDPLFIIDLSDPENPVIEGHVKISGFSTLLVPADKDHLLGLGFSTESTQFGEATDGVKLALFDISDPSVPKVAGSMAFPGMYSEVQYDHKALTAIPDSQDFAIPYELIGSVLLDDTEPLPDDTETLTDDAETMTDGAETQINDVETQTDDAEAPEDVTSDDPADLSSDTAGSGTEIVAPEPTENSTGILVFSAADGKIRTLQDLKTERYVNRCVCIGDYIYGICRDDSIEGFKLGK